MHRRRARRPGAPARAARSGRRRRSSGSTSIATAPGTPRSRASRRASHARRRRDRVARRDREARERQEARVAADQRDVGAVQGRHDARGRGAAFGGQHLAREVRCDGVRQRVVGVDDVEPFAPRHLDDLRRERQRVGRLLELRVGRRRDAMEDEPRSRAGVAGSIRPGQLVAEHVHGVAAARELDGDLGGDDAAAAEGREADDADAQAASRRELMAAAPARGRERSDRGEPLAGPGA